MEIPVVNILSDFQSRLTSLPDTSFLSQTLSISGIDKVSETYSFWKWGALIIAIIASFGTLITKLNIFIVGIRRLRVFSSETFSQKLLNDEFSDYSDDDDDDDETCSISSCSSISDDELEADDETSYDDDSVRSTPRDEHFQVKGSGSYGDGRGQSSNLRLRRRGSFGGHRFSWSDFTAGKSVVKLWEASSPATFLSADTCVSGRVSLAVWDTRVGCRIPAMLAEWGPQIGRIVGVASGGVEKLYVKDGVTGSLTVGDVRNVASPLGNPTDADVDDTWWDADAVIVTDDRFDESAANGCDDSAVTRCCSAVRSYLL